jgi:hypothetical protein
MIATLSPIPERSPLGQNVPTPPDVATMDQDLRKQIAYARMMAEKCRRMAAEETRPAVSDYLNALANDFELDAEDAEAMIASKHRPTVTVRSV